MYDLPQFFIVAGVAGAEQYEGTYPGYGPGIAGYGKRYGAALTDAVSSRIIGSAILPSILHQDPRYFYQGSGGIASRTFHAVSFTFVQPGENGKHQNRRQEFRYRNAWRQQEAPQGWWVNLSE